MAKIININGPLREPGQLTHNGKRYQFLTVGQDKKTVMDYVKTFNPDLQKSIVIANEDLTHYTVYEAIQVEYGVPKGTATAEKSARSKAIQAAVKAL